MERWNYTILNIVFFIPVIIYSWVKYKKLILETKNFLIFAGMFGFVVFFVVDPIATYWKAWEWDYNQTLNITIGYSTFETIYWSILVCVLLALAVEVCTRREEKGKLNLKDLIRHK